MLYHIPQRLNNFLWGSSKNKKKGKNALLDSGKKAASPLSLYWFNRAFSMSSVLMLAMACSISCSIADWAALSAALLTAPPVMTPPSPAGCWVHPLIKTTARTDATANIAKTLLIY
jgi:hypothetical protein